MELSREEQEEITKQAKRFSRAMHAPLVSRLIVMLLNHKIFCSTALSINVHKIFKIVLAKAFDLKVRRRRWLVEGTDSSASYRRLTM
jgi:GTP-binding protein of the ras superfamily involved in termination of M-phase